MIVWSGNELVWEGGKGSFREWRKADTSTHCWVCMGRGEMCSDNWNTSHHRAIITGTHQLDKCISNSWEDQHKACYSSCFDHNLLTPVSRYCAILLIQMVVLVRMAVCVKHDTGTQNNIGGVQQGYYCSTVNSTSWCLPWLFPLALQLQNQWTQVPHWGISLCWPLRSEGAGHNSPSTCTPHHIHHIADTPHYTTSHHKTSHHWHITPHHTVYMHQYTHECMHTHTHTACPAQHHYANLLQKLYPCGAVSGGKELHHTWYNLDLVLLILQPLPNLCWNVLFDSKMM